MNLIELCCCRLAERGIISGEEARVLVTLHRRGKLNGVELAEWSGVEIGEALLSAGRLVALGAAKCAGEKHSAAGISGMAAIIDSAENGNRGKPAAKNEFAYERRFAQNRRAQLQRTQPRPISRSSQGRLFH